MNTLFNAAGYTAIVERLGRLSAEASRQWGKMNPAQMLAHCSVGLEMASGDQPTSQKWIGRLLAPFVRKSALGEAPFRRNGRFGPTDPRFVITDPRDFAAEHQRVLRLLAAFRAGGPEAAGRAVHVFFGKLSGEEWGVLMYKHFDHHLRQFGS